MVYGKETWCSCVEIREGDTSEGHLPSKGNAMSESWCFMTTLICMLGLLERHQSKRTCGCIIIQGVPKNDWLFGSC